MQLRFIEDKLSPDEIRERLRNLPPRLSDAYGEIMKRIENQSHENARRAKEVLLWIVCATRPLNPLELQQGIAVNVGESKLSTNNLTNIDDLVSLCAGLVVVDEQTDVIRLAHYTTQKYLENERARYFPGAHSQIAHKCVAYLCLDSFQTEPPASLYEYRVRHQQYPLYAYAALNWGYHARQAYAKVEEIVENFLQNHFTLKNSLQVLREDRLFPIYKKTILSEFSAIHSAAWFGLDECILGLLRKTSLVDSTDDDGQTALHWAARNGQISTVKLLLRHGFGVNLVDREGKSALHHTVNHGQEALFRVLVDNGANIELADNRGQTPFLYAVENMAVNAAQILLKMGAKAGALNFMKQNSLHLATLGREDEGLQVTTILFSHSDCPNPSASDLDNMTPLHYSVARSHQKLSKLLLQNGADINIGVQRSSTDYRTGNHHMPECKLQADQRRTYNAHNIYGLTPLHFSALVGNSAMTKFVLSEGANVNAHCQNGDTPLHLALRKAVSDLDEVPSSKVSDLKLINIPRIQDAWSDDRWKIECLEDIIDDREDNEAAEIFKTIFEERMKVLDALVTHPDIEVNLVNLNQETPMHLIPFGQDESVTVFSQLINKSAQMCVRNMKAQTPLHIACLKGDFEIAHETLRLDPSSAFECDLRGHCSLHCALRSQDCQLVKMLLGHFDKYNRSACTEVIGKGNNLLHFYLEDDLCNPEMVLVLIDHGVNVNSLNAEGDSPLSIYLRSFHLENKGEICQLLIRNGADPLWRNSQGENLAHIHMHSFVEDYQVLQILEHSGLNVLSKDHGKKSILHHAAIHGPLGEKLIVSLHDSSVSCLYQPDIYGLTPLLYAEGCAREQVEDEFLSGKDWQRTLEFLRKMEESILMEDQIEQ